ncbi:polyprenyl diphosphate synthase [Fischerella sp. PCC 9605]|uniref:polyprenyl diphosphate synthase n=1 Tax=Fischerella sp. PCC 9605 TaxID=1173024 RepID=UPI0004B83F23|nr:polyprenyl diphosphate synthase [Fischerella sp. PCC 9605]
MLIPKHVGFIMDGNGRWATQRGLPRSEGHRAGIQHILTIIDICHNLGVEVVSAYVWSTENWERSQAEVQALMYSIQILGPQLAQKLHDRQVRIIHSGSRQGLSKAVLKVIDDAVQLTKDNGSRILNLAFNYGGRAELLQAVRRAIAQQTSPETITEKTIADSLYTVGLPDVDLIIRSGGDKRMSNFLLWQSAHAWLYFAENYWPALSQHDIEQAIKSFDQGLVRRQNDI